MRANLLVGKLGLLHQTGRAHAKKIPMRALNSVVFVASKLQNRTIFEPSQCSQHCQYIRYVFDFLFESKHLLLNGSCLRLH